MARADLCRKGFALATALALVAGSAVAQADGPTPDWPTIWDVRMQGRPIAAGALADIVDGKTVIFDIGGYADGSGYVFDCAPDSPVSIWYDNGYSAVEPNTRVRIDGARLCIHETGRETCLDIRTMPGWTSPFIQLPLHADRADGDALSADDIAFLKETAATRLVTLPIPAAALIDIRGEIDLGVVAFTLPADLDLTLLGANDFPVFLAIGDPGNPAFRVLVEIIGWPDPYRTPGMARAPRPDDQARARADLEGYRPTRVVGVPSPPGDYGARYLTHDYRFADRTLPGGLCLRVEEHMTVLSDPDGINIDPQTTLYARQFCVAPKGGALFVVTVALNDLAGEDQIAAFWARARGVLESIRIGPSGAQSR